MEILCGAEMTRHNDPVPSIDAELNIVAIDADNNYREMLARELHQRGFRVTPLSGGQLLLDAPEVAADADVILLDWALPGISGIELLRRLRKSGVAVPVVFLASTALSTHEALAFDRGAVDFVDKCRDISIVAHRVRVAASCKSHEPKRHRNFVCGRLLLRPHVSRALWDGVDVELTLGEFRIVQLLARNVGQYVSYRQIYDLARYPGFISGRDEKGCSVNVRSAIKRIRRKFLERDPLFSEIRNFSAFGYAWGRDSTMGS